MKLYELRKQISGKPSFQMSSKRILIADGKSYTNPGMFCNVPSCKHESLLAGPFGLPKSERAREKWFEFLYQCGVEVDDTEDYYLCENHFHPEDITNAQREPVLRANIYPSFVNTEEVRTIIEIASLITLFD